ncbi:MAG: hypothetical protein ABJA20_03175, partial [Novosphingobium sp.]
MKSIYKTGCKVSYAALAGSLLLAAVPALADEAKENAAASSEPEIIVTAQFREQRLQDTPLAITAVNAKMLEARG